MAYTKPGPIVTGILFDDYFSGKDGRYNTAVGGMMMNSVLVVLSGGMDSTTLAYFTHAIASKVEAVSFNYGQRHVKELQGAARTCEYLGIKHHVVDVSSLKEHLASSLTGVGEVPHGLYDDESMKLTVVPNRNMIMLAIAGGLALSRELQFLTTAVHAGDHAIYPDCRPEFIDAARRAIYLGTGEVGLAAPFVNLSKTDIVAIGEQLGVRWDDTWSCYEGGEQHCGRCGTCTERIEAFYNAQATDTADYVFGSYTETLGKLHLAKRLKMTA